MTNRRHAAILAADVAGFAAMMERDEEGTYLQIESLRREIVEPAICGHNGRLVKTTGDGFLGEFANPVEAVRCALTMQSQVADRSNDHAIRLRVGINIGDVIVQADGDLYGDGVNIAARLEQLAEPGGICISGKVYEEVESKLAERFKDWGEQSLRHIGRPIRVFALRSDRPDRTTPRSAPQGLSQSISYCHAPDGVRLAWAKVGQGPPLVKSANYMNHLEYDWEFPIWHHVLAGLAADRTLVRYDARGNGLSDWDVDEVSLEAFVSDLEAVVDAAGLERFPLLGISQGCAVSIVYAVRHPERVSHLALYGGFALGARKRSPHERARRDAMSALIRAAWGADDPSFRQLFTSQFLPEGTKEQAAAFNELQRRTTSPECAARYFDAVGDFDVVDYLPKVTTPTLVMHTRDDLVTPLDEGRKMAAGIPGARFVALHGRNHLFLEGEPASETFFTELRSFLHNG